MVCLILDAWANTQPQPPGEKAPSLMGQQSWEYPPQTYQQQTQKQQWGAQQWSTPAPPPPVPPPPSQPPPPGKYQIRDFNSGDDSDFNSVVTLDTVFSGMYWQQGGSYGMSSVNPPPPPPPEYKPPPPPPN